MWPTLRGLASSMTWVMDAGGRMGLKGAISVPDGGWNFTRIDWHKHNTTQGQVKVQRSCRVIKHVPRHLYMDLFHIYGFLSSRSRHSWVNLKSSEWESTTNIFFAFPFAQIEKKNTTVFLWLSIKGNNLREIDIGSRKREPCQICHPSHRHCIRNVHT